MRYKLIAAVSKDGFIARNSEDSPSNWTSKEEQIKFKKDIHTCDWSAMGRKTHELNYNRCKKRIIFSKSVDTYKYISHNHIYFNPRRITFKKIVSLISPISTICILGGTKVHDYFFENKLIDELIITVEQIKFKKGLPLFSKLNWNNFPEIFYHEGLKLNDKIQTINSLGTKYYHFIKN